MMDMMDTGTNKLIDLSSTDIDVSEFNLCDNASRAFAQLATERNEAILDAEYASEALDRISEAIRILTRFMKRSNLPPTNETYVSDQQMESDIFNTKGFEDKEGVNRSRTFSNISTSEISSNRTRTFSNMSASEMSSNRIRTFSNISVVSHHSTDEQRLSAIMNSDSLPPKVGSELIALTNTCRMVVEQASWITQDSLIDFDEARRKEKEAERFARKAERVARKFYEQNKILKQELQDEKQKYDCLFQEYNASLNSNRQLFQRQQEESDVRTNIIFHEQFMKLTPKTKNEHDENDQTDSSKKYLAEQKVIKRNKATSYLAFTSVEDVKPGDDSAFNGKAGSVVHTLEPCLNLDDENDGQLAPDTSCISYSHELNNQSEDPEFKKKTGFGSIFTTVPSFRNKSKQLEKEELESSYEVHQDINPSVASNTSQLPPQATQESSTENSFAQASNRLKDTVLSDDKQVDPVSPHPVILDNSDDIDSNDLNKKAKSSMSNIVEGFGNIFKKKDKETLSECVPIDDSSLNEVNKKSTNEDEITPQTNSSEPIKNESKHPIHSNESSDSKPMSNLDEVQQSSPRNEDESKIKSFFGNIHLSKNTSTMAKDTKVDSLKTSTKCSRDCLPETIEQQNLNDKVRTEHMTDDDILDCGPSTQSKEKEDSRKQKNSKENDLEAGKIFSKFSFRKRSQKDEANDNCTTIEHVDTNVKHINEGGSAPETNSSKSIEYESNHPIHSNELTDLKPMSNLDEVQQSSPRNEDESKIKSFFSNMHFSKHTSTRPKDALADPLKEREVEKRCNNSISPVDESESESIDTAGSTLLQTKTRKNKFWPSKKQTLSSSDLKKDEDDISL